MRNNFTRSLSESFVRMSDVLLFINARRCWAIIRIIEWTSASSVVVFACAMLKTLCIFRIKIASIHMYLQYMHFVKWLIKVHNINSNIYMQLFNKPTNFIGLISENIKLIICSGGKAFSWCCCFFISSIRMYCLSC